MKLPDLILLNKYRLGDSVLCESVASSLAKVVNQQIFVASNYPEVFNNNPSVRGLALDSTTWPFKGKIIDLSQSIYPFDEEEVFLPDKLKRMYEQVGFNNESIATPKLYLADDEKQHIEHLKYIFPRKRIGCVLTSRDKAKNWPYMKSLIKQLSKDGVHVFAFAAKEDEAISWIERLPVNPVIGLPLREAIMYIGAMDMVISHDTGLSHVAGALGIPTKVVTFACLGDIYSVYDSCEVIGTNLPSKYSLYTISPRAVIKSMPKKQVKKAVKREDDTVAFFRLDGMGGTVTLADHAKKLYEKIGMKATIIARSYADLFKDNPYVKQVVEVGYDPWNEVLSKMVERFSVLVEIRFAIPKCHQNGMKIFEDSVGHFGAFFDSFPNGLKPLESEKLHHVQITDRQLGFPYDTIDSEVYYWEKPLAQLPDEYVVFSNGVDRQHRDMRQTKVWNGWEELADILEVPMVQIGSEYDPQIKNAIDLRGKTTIPQLVGLVKESSGVVCTEGGMMHLSHACGCDNVVVIRGPTRGKLFEYPGQTFVDSYVCNACWGTTDDWFMNCPRGIKSYCMDSIIPERVAFHLEEGMHEDMAKVAHL